MRRRYWTVRYNINLRMHPYSDWGNTQITVWATKGIQCHALFVCHRGVPCMEFGDKLTAVQLQCTDYHAQKSVVYVWSGYRVIWISLAPWMWPYYVSPTYNSQRNSLTTWATFVIGDSLYNSWQELSTVYEMTIYSASYTSAQKTRNSVANALEPRPPRTKASGYI